MKTNKLLKVLSAATIISTLAVVDYSTTAQNNNKVLLAADTQNPEVEVPTTAINAYEAGKPSMAAASIVKLTVQKVANGYKYKLILKNVGKNGLSDGVSRLWIEDKEISLQSIKYPEDPSAKNPKLAEFTLPELKSEIKATVFVQIMEDLGLLANNPGQGTKKTILSQVLLATFALTSASAMAATVYSDKGTQVDLYGRFGAYFDKTKDTNTDLKDDKTRLGFKVTHELGQDLTALGGVELRFSDVNKRFSDPMTHDAYAGFKYNPVGTFTFGRQATTADDLALSKYAYQHEDVTLAPTQGDRTVKFRSTSFGQEGWGYISAGVDHTFKGSTNKDANIRQASTGAGLFYTNNFGDVGFKLNSGYVYSQNDGTMANTNPDFDNPGDSPF